MDTDYEHMSRESRISRIGHILSKGVSLMLANEMRQREMRVRAALTAGAEAHGETACDSELPDDSKAIVVYLKRVGSASPVEIQRYAGVPKTTAFKRLRQLQAARIVIKTGDHKKVRYSIVDRADEPREPTEPILQQCQVVQTRLTEVAI